MNPDKTHTTKPETKKRQETQTLDPTTLHWEQVVVTPQLAEAWLKTSQGNRSLRKDKVAQYARTMKAGRWQLTDQGVSFSDTGHLLNGHHRLEAVKDAQTYVKMWVVRGLPESAKQAMDLGIKRTLADIFNLSDKPPKEATYLVALARMLLGLFESSYAAKSPSFEEISEILEQEQEAISWAQPYLGHKKNQLPTVVLAALCLAYPTDPERVESFAYQLATKIGLKAKTGPLLLRNFLDHLPTNRGGEIHRSELALRTLNALRLFFENKTGANLRTTEDGRLYFLSLRNQTHPKTEQTELNFSTQKPAEKKKEHTTI